MLEPQALRSVVDICRGASPRPIGDPKYFGGDVGWIRISDVTRASRVLLETEQYVSPLGQSLSVTVRPGDLIMSICATLGRPIITGIPACIHDGFVLFSNFKNIDKNYLYYVLQFSEPKFYAMGQPGTQVNLNTNLVGGLKIFVPTIKQQTKISEVLSVVDDTIEHTSELISKYQQIKAGLMQDLFTRGVTADGKLRPSREEAPGLYKESPIGWIPKAWGIKNLKEISHFITSGSRGWADFYSDTGPLFLRIGNLTREHINFRWDSIVRVSLPNTTEGTRTSVAPNDILISITADLGIVAVVPDFFEEAYVNQHIALIRPKVSSKTARFLGNFLCTLAVQEQFIKLNDSGAKAGLNLPAVGRILVALPDTSHESETISGIIDSVDQQILSFKREREKLEQKKLGLMQDLLTGRVTVPTPSVPSAIPDFA